MGRDSVEVASVLGSLGGLYEMWGRYPQSLAANQRALAITRQKMPEESIDVAFAHNNLGVSLLRLKRYDEALAQHRKALEILEKVVGEDHVYVAHPLWGIGNDLLGMERAKEAVAALRRGMAIREKQEKDLAEVGEMRFSLARALWASGQHDAARRAAEVARAELTRAGSRSEELREVSQWLQSHGG